MRIRQTLVMCAISLAFVGCATTVSKDEYNQVASQAENEIKLAKKSGFIWLNTEKFLKESKEHMDKAEAASDRATRVNESNTALKLAKKALAEAKLAQQQAKDNAKPDTSIPKI